MQFIDKKTQEVVYTALQDEILGVSDVQAIYVPPMTSPQYQKNVRDYLTKHLDNLIIHKLRTNQPLTVTESFNHPCGA